MLTKMINWLRADRDDVLSLLDVLGGCETRSTAA